MRIFQIKHSEWTGNRRVRRSLNMGVGAYRADAGIHRCKNKSWWGLLALQISRVYSTFSPWYVWLKCNYVIIKGFLMLLGGYKPVYLICTSLIICIFIIWKMEPVGQRNPGNKDFWEYWLKKGAFVWKNFLQLQKEPIMKKGNCPRNHGSTVT